ncbi:hypothetical protein ACT691_16590 [Vibrio metschnikovii]
MTGLTGMGVFMIFYRNSVRWAALGCLLIMITACKPNPQDDILIFRHLFKKIAISIADDLIFPVTVRPGDKNV